MCVCVQSFIFVYELSYCVLFVFLKIFYNFFRIYTFLHTEFMVLFPILVKLARVDAYILIVNKQTPQAIGC